MQQKGAAFLPVEKLKDARVLNKELHRTLYGFIVFEVEWANVRGINYLNELQVEIIIYLLIYIFFSLFLLLLVYSRLVEKCSEVLHKSLQQGMA
jgi:hypothetical protein